MLRNLAKRTATSLRAVAPSACENAAYAKQNGRKAAFGLLSIVGGASVTAFGIAKRFTTQAEAAGAPKFTLYQYQVCPFCNKAQAYLEFSGVPHKRVEVNPLSKKEIKFSDYKMVPFMIVEDANGSKTQVNGSDAIVDYISTNVTKTNDKEDQDIKVWRDWVNDRLVKLLPPNIYRTPGEALQAFDYIARNSNFSLYEKVSAKYAGALAMYFIARKASQSIISKTPDLNWLRSSTNGLKGISGRERLPWRFTTG